VPLVVDVEPMVDGMILQICHVPCNVYDGHSSDSLPAPAAVSGPSGKRHDVGRRARGAIWPAEAQDPLPKIVWRTDH
jgi:hypothetical protein